MKKKYGRNLKKFRLKNNLSIQDVSEALAIPEDLLRDYESGKGFIDKKNALLLAGFLDFDPYFIGIDIPLGEKPQTSILAPLHLTERVSVFKVIKSIFTNIIYAFKKPKKEVNTNIVENQLFSLHENSQQPFVFLRIAILLLGVAGLSYLAESVVISNLALSLVVPFSLMWFLLEYHHPRLIRGYELIRYFLYGGLISIIIVFIIRFFTGMSNTPSIFDDLLTGLVEELAKAITVIFLLRKRMVKHVLEGILVGFAIGAGFSVVETTMYGINDLLANKDFIQMMVLIAVRSAFDLFGAGHHFWAGILGGVLVMINRTGHLKFKDIFNKTFVFWYLLMALIHGLFNYTGSISIAYVAIVCFVSLVIFIVFWIKASQDYHLSLNRLKTEDDDYNDDNYDNSTWIN